MALPDKKIKKIQLPGDVQGDKTYEIVPEMLQRDGFGAVLPRMDEDGTLALENDIWADGETSGTNLIAIPGDFKGNAIDVTEFAGNSFVVNQLVQNGNFVSTSNWYMQNGTFSVSGNIATFTQTNLSAYTRLTQTLANAPISGHAYLLVFEVKHNYTESIDIQSVFGRDIEKTVSPNSWYSYEALYVCNYASQYATISSKGGVLSTACNVQVRNVIFIDLTRAGLTSAEMDSYATAKTALKKRGFDVDMWGHMPNMFDGQLTQINSKAVRGTNFIPATPNTRLNISFQSSVSSTYGFMQFYDASQTNIGEQRYNSGDDVTIPTGCAYVKPQFNHSSSDITPSDISNVYLTYSFYQPGALMDCKPIKLISRGYNLFDGQFHFGSSHSQLYSSNIQAIGTKSLTLLTNGFIQWSGLYVREYDANGTLLRTNSFYSPSAGSYNFTIGNDCSYFDFYFYNGTDITDGSPNVVIKIESAPNLGYKPHRPSVDISLTTDYVRSALDARDDTEDRYVGTVDMGTLVWGKYSLGFQARFLAAKSSQITSQKSNILCAKYVTVSATGGTTPKSILLSPDNYVRVTDADYSDVATFQTAMSGVMLNYELATKTAFVGSDLPKRVPVEAGGSVEVVCASLAIPYETQYRWQTLVDVPTAVSELSNDAGYATVSYVDQRIDDLPEPMVFKGSLGTGGTISTLPVASSDNKGFTYKVITAGTYQGLVCKVGDTVISDGSAWVLIPSGDEPSGTVTSVGLQAGSGSNLSVSGSPITSSGTMTVSVASGYSIPSTDKQAEWDAKQDSIYTLGANDSDRVSFDGYVSVYDDENESDVAPRPANSINPSWDCDLYIYGTGFTVYNGAGDDEYMQYSFPNHSGTFAMTNDIGLTLLDLRGYVDA